MNKKPTTQKAKASKKPLRDLTTLASRAGQVKAGRKSRKSIRG